MRKKVLVASLIVAATVSPAVATAAPVTAPTIGTKGFDSHSDNDEKQVGDVDWVPEKEFQSAADKAAEKAKSNIAKAKEAAQKVVDENTSGQVRSTANTAIAQASEAAGKAVEDMKDWYNKTASKKLVSAAMAQIGTPYVWGGSQPGGFDCSGLVQWAANKAGVQVPRVAVDQANSGHNISFDELKPGDLVSYTGGSHIAIYIGDGQVVHAPETGDVVKVSPVNMMNYYMFTRVA